MPSPFPGMDPYLESPKHWRDFHARFISEWSNSLNQQLPRRYLARVEERIALARTDDEDTQAMRPDVAIMRSGPAPLRLASEEMDAELTATLDEEPAILPIGVLEEEPDRYIRIVRHPDRTLVAVLELLSPWNKVNPGRREYLGHRQELFRQPVHLIELDLLVAGQRIPVGGRLPGGDYYAIVTRWDRRPDCEAYAWSVRQRLPAIRVPLSSPDLDLRLELQPIFDRVFDAGRCAEAIEYGEPLAAPLANSDREWAEERGRLA